MNKQKRRIAINVGAKFVPGMNSVLTGAALAADELGWELVGIRDGFDGLIHPDGGLVTLDRRLAETLDPAAGSALGLSAMVDPFNVRQINDDGFVEETDLSGALLEALEAQGIDALISVVGGRGLSIFYKLHRKGLDTICIPRAIENDIAATAVSFGFNTALTFSIEMLDRARQAAQASRQIAVVEVGGERAGWLALQAGIAAGADAILIPEISADLSQVAEKLQERITPQRPYGLVVVAEGASFADGQKSESKPSSFKASMSPLATGEAGSHVIQRSGQAARTVASRLQQLLAEEAHPLVLGPWVRGGAPTAVDRQLGLGYGAGAVTALKEGKGGAMIAFQPPDIDAVPLVEAINKIRTVPADSEMMEIALALGICLGGEL